MKVYFVDSFTTEKFKGNPAAVCFPESDADPQEDRMQKIAFEIGFSETAFVRHLEGDTYSIRFFTPKKEIPLCGHATLAAAKVIFENRAVETITFQNREHVRLPIARKERRIVMEFPVYDTQDVVVPPALTAALGIDQLVCARLSPRNGIILLEMEDPARLARLQPDFQALVNSHSGINGVLLTARSRNPNYDFEYRYFWPWAGTNEDPVTGGVQTFLTRYWAEILHKNTLRAFQSSFRTGSMVTELRRDKVLIYGEAVIVLEGTLR
ncbi:MAG TPA: PhzF family phenazine biosynthesis isomerase [Chitinophagaceae bacterium]|nr:PhzF family phenazine biosynthesis isomerase [Chitinophagaceae bacterium]